MRIYYESDFIFLKKTNLDNKNACTYKKTEKKNANMEYY